jgi:hypothetical protein
VLTTIKDNVTHIEEQLKTFERNLMFDRKVIQKCCSQPPEGSGGCCTSPTV